ncbi:LacI family transcriptional regulator [Actinopolymorpha cephalotaxi]|uniref:LacI family transcriptional regulator n=1 Tax=Actinopolymorpha cephalotaxi TaxID=504797 RepID=A0A1I2LIT9_9ACTN|nr:substrate-binding domain-containing protein [Actinopolymorpha cephalotaxi]SFF78973.1 LacI family transcriptional regulator [Actinopolymorpha cephalotaxi]
MAAIVESVGRTPHSSARRRGIRDVAELAGVSVGTVSNVLNKPALVAEETRRRVEEAIATLGFVRNGSARQLRAGTSRAVGAIVLDIANPFFTDVARGIEDRLAEDDHILILASSDESNERELRYLRLLEEQGVQGVLVSPAEEDLTWLDQARARGTAVVLLDRSDGGTMCSVGVDDVRGGELAAAHLISLGHRRIAFVNGPTKIRQCADRRKGVRKALKAAGLTLSGSLVEVTVSALNADGGEQALTRVLDQADGVTAILCVNDLTALGVLRGLRARGLGVPDDVAVVGYDDVEFAAVLTTPLTSIRQPRYQIGRAAADLLLAEAGTRGQHEHEQVLFQPELVVRESSGPHQPR